MRFPPDPLARFPHMRADEEAIVRDRNREQYARYVPFSTGNPDPADEPSTPPPSTDKGERRNPDAKNKK